MLKIWMRFFSRLPGMDFRQDNIRDIIFFWKNEANDKPGISDQYKMIL